MNQPLALIEGSLAIPKPRPFDGLPPPFGSRRRTAPGATKRAPQPVAQTEAQQAMQDAVQRRPLQARPGPFPPGAKLLFYKVPQRRVDSHRFDTAMAEAKHYLEAGRARPRSSRSDHILGGAIFLGCGIALAWLLTTCAMRDANKASELALKLPVVPAVSSPPVVDSQEPIKLAQLAVGEKQTIPRSVLSAANAESKAVAPSPVEVPQPVSSATRHAAAGIVQAPSTTSYAASIAVPAHAATSDGAATLATHRSKATQLSQRATQVLPRQTVQVIAGDDEVATPPTKPAKRVKVARLSEAHVNERVALSRAIHPATQPAMSKQPEWAASASRARDDISSDEATWRNWSTQQHRPSPSLRAATPLDNSWNDHMTQRRITDDPGAFHTDSGK
jgi:hypothetical protein